MGKRDRICDGKWMKNAMPEALVETRMTYSHSWSSEVRYWIDDTEFNLETI